jgi:hypothetical protein
MTPKTLTYYEWDELQAELCRRLGIEFDDFRKYHKVVGGEYKDFWHAWLEMFDVRNDTYCTVCVPMDGDEYSPDQDFGWMLEDEYQWAKELPKALAALGHEMKVDEFVVLYSW